MENLLSYHKGYGMIELNHIPVVDSYLEQARDGVVVDLGCGSSDHGLKARWARIFCAIEKDRATVADIINPKPNIQVLIADAKSTPILTASVDVVLAFGLFGNLDIYRDGSTDFDDAVGALSDVFFSFAVEQRVKKTLVKRSQVVMAEMIRMLKPNGVVLISNHLKRQPQKDFCRILRRHFSQIEVQSGTLRYLVIARK